MPDLHLTPYSVSALNPTSLPITSPLLSKNKAAVHEVLAYPICVSAILTPFSVFIYIIEFFAVHFPVKPCLEEKLICKNILNERFNRGLTPPVKI